MYSISYRRAQSSLLRNHGSLRYKSRITESLLPDHHRIPFQRATGASLNDRSSSETGLISHQAYCRISQVRTLHKSLFSWKNRGISDPTPAAHSSINGYDSLIDPHLDPSLIARVNNPQSNGLVSPHFIEYYQDQTFMEDLDHLLLQKISFISKAEPESTDADTEIAEARIERALQKKMARLKSRKDTIDQFKKQREVAFTTFLNKENSKWLFEPKNKVNWGEYGEENVYLRSKVSSYVETEHLLSGGRLSHSRPEIQNTLLLLSKLFINTFLVEINVHSLLGDGGIQGKFKNDPFLAQDLIIRRFDKDKKQEILAILTELYSVEREGVPKSLQEFISGLNRKGVSEIIQQSRVNESFSSLADYRLKFSHYKSSQHLNYDRSDLTRLTQSYQPVRFHSREVKNDEFERKFDRAFADYESSSDPFKHLELLLQLARILVTSRSYTPDHTIFKVLMEKLVRCGLYTYLTLVYESLPAGKYVQSVLGNDPRGEKLPKQSFHFQKIVEECPGIISTLLENAVRSKDEYSFRQMLKFFRLKDISGYESGLSKSGYNELLSFSKHRKGAVALLTVRYDTNESLWIPAEFVYQAIKGCIQLNEFGYIDPLVTLLILQSKEVNGKHEVELNFDRNPQIGTDSIFYSLMLGAKQLSQKIYTKELIMLSLEAIRKDKDFSRLTYLVPHLDSYVIRNLETSGGHLQTIRKHFHNKVVRKVSTQKEDAEFTETDCHHPLGLALIEAIFKTLFQFMDRRQVYSGLFPTFDELLDFNNTVSELVAEKEAKKYKSDAARDAFVLLDRLRPVK